MEHDFYDDDGGEPDETIEDYNAAGEAVASALGGGADPETIAQAAAGLMQAGYGEAESLEAAAGAYDLSGLDENQALAKIAAREGWS